MSEWRLDLLVEGGRALIAAFQGRLPRGRLTFTTGVQSNLTRFVRAGENGRALQAYTGRTSLGIASVFLIAGAVVLLASANPSQRADS